MVTIMKRYDTCIREDGDCAVCSMSSYGRDCHNNPANRLAYLRTLAGLTQQQLANKSKIHIGQVQKIEYGQRDIGGVSLRIGLAIADALGVDPHELL